MKTFATVMFVVFLYLIGFQTYNWIMDVPPQKGFYFVVIVANIIYARFFWLKMHGKTWVVAKETT